MSINKKYLHSETTNIILKAFYTIINEIPFGLNPEVYKKALKVECEIAGLAVEIDYEKKIIYKNKNIGSFTIDLIVENQVIVKIASDLELDNRHDYLVKSQLKLTDFEVALILNFGVEGNHKRLVLTNDLKNNNW